MHRALTLSLFLLITLVATAQSGSPVTYLNPGEVFHPPGYSAAVVVTAAKLVYVSGQVALNSRGDLVGKGDFAGQVTQIFENLQAVLAAAGTTPAHLVKLNYYVVGLDDEKLKVLREVRNRYIKTSSPPASTLAGVQALFRKDVLVEIEAVAVVP